MRFVPTTVHGVIDYLTGIALIVAPWLLGFATGGAAQWVAVLLGLGAILYSLATDYELGVLRVFPMPTHLALDAGSGFILAISPWLFGFANQVWVPHLVVGLFEIVMSLITRTVPRGGARERAGALDRGPQRL